jgi:hypothetical protein
VWWNVRRAAPVFQSAGFYQSGDWVITPSVQELITERFIWLPFFQQQFE